PAKRRYVVDDGKVIGRARQDEGVGKIAIALIDETTAEFLLEIIKRQRVELLEDVLATELGERLLGRHLRCFSGSALRVLAEEPAEPRRNGLPAVVWIPTQLL